MSKRQLRAVLDFFTNSVELPVESKKAERGSIWIEHRDGWCYPWRVTGEMKGYPCGEPYKENYVI